MSFAEAAVPRSTMSISLANLESRLGNNWRDTAESLAVSIKTDGFAIIDVQGADADGIAVDGLLCCCGFVLHAVPGRCRQEGE